MLINKIICFEQLCKFGLGGGKMTDHQNKGQVKICILVEDIVVRFFYFDLP